MSRAIYWGHNDIPNLGCAVERCVLSAQEEQVQMLGRAYERCLSVVGMVK
jgi:hypothetical protein